MPVVPPANPSLSRSRSVSLVAAVGLLAAATCPSVAWATPESAKVVIGLLLPPEEAEAASLRDGVQLAVEHANLAPTSSVSLVIRGRVGQWGADAVEAARMVLDDGAQGLIAPPNGAATHLALQVAGRTAVPVISLCADSSVSRTGVPWMVRIAPTTIEEAQFLLAGQLADSSDPPPWVAVVPDGRAGREVSRDLNRAASVAQRKLKRVCELSSTLTNVQSVVAQVLKEQPKGVLVWLDPVPAGKVTKSLREAGFSGRLAGPSRCNSPAFLSASAQAPEGFLVPAIALDKPGEARLLSFQTAYRQRYGIQADPTAAEGYDAARLLVHILEKHDPQSLPQAFPLAFSLPGASGNLSFDAEGNRKIALRLLVARRGSFVAVEPGQK
jgi:ABC-type branched-subunit amino acid transport system substrate-binding protein